MSGSGFRTRTLSALFAGLIVVLGCAAPSSYERDGYSVRRVGSDHYQVAYTGNAGADLQDVKNRVLQRAAEVTLRAGYSHFVIYTNSAQAEIASPNNPFWSSENSSPAGVTRGGSSLSRASAYKGMGEANLNTRYTALSEIIVLKGEEAMRNPDALSAQAVLDRFTSRSSSEPRR